MLEIETASTSADKKKRKGLMNISPHAAELIFDIANWALVAALFVGVIATYFIFITANIKEADVKERLAQSHERAAKLEKEAAQAGLETQRLKQHMAWRRVSQQQAEVLIARLKGKKISVWLTFVGDDPEATVFREDIDQALRAAGVETVLFSGYAKAVGLSISHEKLPERQFLIEAFKEAGLPLIEADRKGMGQHKGQLEILVGTKPPPF